MLTLLEAKIIAVDAVIDDRDPVRLNAIAFDEDLLVEFADRDDAVETADIFLLVLGALSTS